MPTVNGSITDSAGTQQGARPGRGRRPAGELRTEVLETTTRLLLEVGIKGITFEKVAAATPCSKVTLYRWWSSPGLLAAEAFFAAAGPALAFHDTGDLEVDLRAQLREWVAFLGSPEVGPVIARLIGAAQDDAELAAAWSRGYSLPRRLLAVERLEAARARGEIAAAIDTEVMVDQLWGSCYHRLLLPDQPLDTAFTDALVTNLLYGVATPGRDSSA